VREEYLHQKSSTLLTDFANGLSESEARILAASQWPATIAALNEPSGAPGWRTIPSWYLIGTEDHLISPDAERAMPEHAARTSRTSRAGHLGLISDPGSVTRAIERAAQATG
jgi:pimeloyl-ACP methyl ester carboxylesterase